MPEIAPAIYREEVCATFAPDKVGVLFFSRGRGHGHAVPDMAIASQLERLRTDFDLRFVSYGTGAKTLIEHGKAVIDLDLPRRKPAMANGGENRTAD